jgi:hypothetical protein
MKQVSVLSMAVGFLLCVCLPVLLGAQTTLGVRAGISLATFGGGPIGTSYEYREGLNIGAYLDLSLSERLGLQIGAGYAQKGADLTAETELGTLDWENPIGYLEIPILLRVEVAPGSRVSPQILFGPALSMTTSCEWKTEISGNPLRINCDDPGFEIRSVDFGAMGGVSLKVALSERIALVGDSFFAFGLRSVGEGGDSVKNRAFSLSLGLAFLLG